METIILYSIIYIIEALILWQYCSNMFSQKYPASIECLCSILLYIVPFLTVFQKNIWINALTFTCANLIYIFAFFKTRWYTAFFHSVIISIIMSGSEILIVGLISDIAYGAYENTDSLSNLVILTAFSKLLYFIILQVIVYVWGHFTVKGQTYNFSISVLTIIPIISLFIVITLGVLSMDTILSPTQDKMIAISSLLLLFINIIVFGIYNYNQRKSQEFAALQIQYQKESDSAEYYKMLIEQHENQSLLIHDIKKHLNSISTLNQQGDTEAVSTYINQIISSPDLRGSVRVSDNKMLNAILCRYIRLCQDKRIDFRPDIRSGCMDFVQEADLTALICNLLDNAVESASKQQNSHIEITAGKKENTPFTLLTVINSCRTNPFSSETGSLLTSKKDKLRHGYGIKSIKRIVHKYGGEMEMYYHAETTTFHTIITLVNNPSERSTRK